MARKKDRSPEEIARREKIRELLQLANVGSMDDIHELFKETIGEFMENGLEAELDEELGYNRYDYRNKTTDNSRNGHSSKKLKTSYGEIEIETPRDRKGEFVLHGDGSCVSVPVYTFVHLLPMQAKRKGGAAPFPMRRGMWRKSRLRSHRGLPVSPCRHVTHRDIPPCSSKLSLPFFP